VAVSGPDLSPVEISQTEALSAWRTYQTHVGDNWCAECSSRGPCDPWKWARERLIAAGLLMPDGALRGGALRGGALRGGALRGGALRGGVARS
jgi:hypothetical protein